ncbi:MAG: hypothetical protein ABJC87_21695, partial [Roseobacter sp.]
CALQQKIGQRGLDGVSTREVDDGSVVHGGTASKRLAGGLATPFQPDAPPPLKPPEHQTHS